MAKTLLYYLEGGFFYYRQRRSQVDVIGWLTVSPGRRWWLATASPLDVAAGGFWPFPGGLVGRISGRRCDRGDCLWRRAALVLMGPMGRGRRRLADYW
jgi:hypothetical protein